MRYNMLIAEDEQDEYELVIYLLKKLGLDQTFQIFHAKNGKLALEALEKEQIDLLFTDIKMPFANGLEIAGKAREKNADMPIVFFSCYDDFSYIKTALTVKACNYLLKPLDPIEFEKTIYQTLEQIRITEKEKETLQKRKIATKNHYLYQILNHKEGDLAYLKENGVDKEFVKEYTRILMIHFETSFFDMSKKEEAEFINFLNELLGISADIINLNPLQSVLLLKNSDKTRSSDVLKKHCVNVRKKIRERYGVDAYLVISRNVTEEYTLGMAFDHINSLLEKRFFEPQCHVICEETKNFGTEDCSELCTTICQEIEKDIEMQDITKIQLDIQRINQIFEQSKNYSHIFVRYTYSQLLQILYKGHDWKEIQETQEKIFSSSFIFEIEKIIENAMAVCCRSIVNDGGEKSRAVVFVQQYIAAHYMEQISLNDLAQQVYLNASYLSTVFKIEMGSGINEYVKKIRMEKAKQILEHTNKKVSSIAKEVGFLNTSYFIKSFHEYYGKTPSKIRQE